MKDYSTLVAWQVANQLTIEVYRISTDCWQPETSAIWDQLRRAALSTSLNIAEGYRWRPGRKWGYHLRVALGSAAEASVALRTLEELGALPQEKARELIICSQRAGKLIWGLLKRA